MNKTLPLALKEATDEVCLISLGMSFQGLGAMTEKVLSPHVAVLDNGTTSMDYSEERRVHSGDHVETLS